VADAIDDDYREFIKESRRHPEHRSGKGGGAITGHVIKEFTGERLDSLDIAGTVGTTTAKPARQSPTGVALRPRHHDHVFLT